MPPFTLFLKINRRTTLIHCLSDCFHCSIQPFMTTDINQIRSGNKEFRDVPIDLEFNVYLFEVYLNDRIEDKILRMMEHCGEKSSGCITIRPIYAPNKL